MAHPQGAPAQGAGPGGEERARPRWSLVRVDSEIWGTPKPTSERADGGGKKTRHSPTTPLSAPYSQKICGGPTTTAGRRCAHIWGHGRKPRPCPLRVFRGLRPQARFTSIVCHNSLSSEPRHCLLKEKGREKGGRKHAALYDGRTGFREPLSGWLRNRSPGNK